MHCKYLEILLNKEVMEVFDNTNIANFTLKVTFNLMGFT